MAQGPVPEGGARTSREPRAAFLPSDIGQTFRTVQLCRTLWRVFKKRFGKIETAQDTLDGETAPRYP